MNPASCDTYFVFSTHRILVYEIKQCMQHIHMEKCRAGFLTSAGTLDTELPEGCWKSCACFTSGCDQGTYQNRSAACEKPGLTSVTRRSRRTVHRNMLPALSPLSFAGWLLAELIVALRVNILST